MLRPRVSTGLSILFAGVAFTWAGPEVLTTKRFTLSHDHANDTVTLRKIRDRETGDLSIASSRPDRVADLQQLSAIREQLHRKKREQQGNIWSGLEARLRKSHGQERIPVVIYLRCERPPQPPKCVEPNNLRDDFEELRRTARERMGKEDRSIARAVTARYGIEAQNSSYYHIVALVRAETIVRMRFDQDITHVVENTPGRPLAEIATLSNSGYNPVPAGGIGSCGQGVRAATIELYHLQREFLHCLGNIDLSQVDNSPGSQTGHQDKCFKVLWNTAPSADFYYFHIGGMGDANFASGCQRVIDNSVQTVSYSYGVGDNPPQGPDHPQSLILDRQAYDWMGAYPVWAVPTANDGWELPPDRQPYNALIVGNVQHWNEEHFVLDAYSLGCTQTDNPGGTDRELPHIVAPGATPSGPYMTIDCLPGFGYCGTSLSAPVSNGLAAAALGADSRMAYWPEKVRAALILTAHNVEGGDWDQWDDGRDGTGTVSGTDAIGFAQEHSTVFPGATYGSGTPVKSGLCVGSLNSTDENSDLYFRAAVPSPLPSDRHLRAVLVWDSSPGDTRNGLSDLDLYGWSDEYPDGENYSSTSWGSNVEVVDVWDATTSGQAPGFQVHVWSTDFPAGSESYIYYCIAWDWVRNHAD